MSIRAITFDFWFTLFREANGKPRQRTRAEALSRATVQSVGEEHDRDRQQHPVNRRRQRGVGVDRQHQGAREVAGDRPRERQCVQT